MGGKYPPKHGQNTQNALLGTNISPKKAHLKIIFLFPSWDM